MSAVETSKTLDTFLKNPYKHEYFKNFIIESFGKNIDIKTEQRTPFDKHNSIITSYSQMCENITLDSQILSIYAFETTSINAKITLHKEIAEIIKNQPEINAMLAVFYDESKEFRLSLVTQGFDYEKNKTTFSNLRRQSFTLGENTKTKTAKLQLQGFLDKEKTLKNLQEAFSTEPISKEFYRDYERLYKDLSQKLCQNQATFNALNNYEGLNGEKAVNAFVKKLLGRIVFLYFLQKKGWLGVAHNDSYGTGDKSFLFSLFSKATQNNESFYTKYLCPLFFETLNTQRENDYSPHFDCKIPFLNGGLFEECKDKQGKGIETNFILTQSLENTDFEAIFDVFENYNFTIEESTPDNQEIGIDPEMLGKVFENLIDYNKSSGAFYTPREIVHFMCKNVLTRTLQERILHDESHLTQDTESPHAHKDSLYNFIFYKQSDDFIAQNAKQLTQAITSLKILDPAIGSGAFPMGMLSEILEALHTLNPSLSRQDIARLKREIIEQQIYGIDIDADAIEIAKLRFWLSIAVDEDTPSPLPNLDFKFMRGNALIESINGIEIIPSDLNAPQHQKNLLGRDENASLFDKSQTNKLEALFLQYYEPNAQKAQLKAEILAIMKEAFDERIKQIDENIQSIKANPKSKSKDRAKQQEEILQYESFKYDLDTLLKDYKEHNFHTDKLFLYRFFFAPVFANGGFDIVIGNPPYISAPNQLKDTLLNAQRESIKKCGFYNTLHKKWDLYIPFIERSIAYLCRDTGICAFIIPYPFTNQPYAQKSREMIIKEYCLCELVDLHETKVFQAEVLNCILIMSKMPQKEYVPIAKITQSREIKRIYHKSIKELIQDDKNFVWNTAKEKQDSNRYAHFHTLGDFCYISVGMGLHSSEKNTQYKFKKQDLISQSKDEIHCRVYIKGKDVEKYNIKHIKYLEYGTERCPSQCREPRFKELFEVDKIVVGRVGYIKATIDCTNLVCNHTLNCIVLWYSINNVKNKSIDTYIKKSKLERKIMEKLSLQVNLHYLLGILNSYYANILLDEIRGKAIDLYPNYLKQLPIPKITESNQHIANSIITLVENILESKAKNINTKDLESQIDNLVYTLYGLDSKEIQIIEGGKK